MNPIRYRGYYYDEETGLYYLQSRYYDPEVGRFINADDVDYIEPETLMGCNLYAYCGNNPVMYVDPTGNFAISFFVGLAVSFVVGFAVSTVSQGLQYGWDNINYWQVAIDGLFAAASTALSASGIGAILGRVINAAMSVGQYAIGTVMHGEKLTLSGIVTATALGLITGGAGASNGKVLARDMSGRAATGMKAVITTVVRYGKNSIQYKKIMNLYGKTIADTVQGIVNKNFTRSVIFGLGSMPISTAIQFGASFLPW